MARHHPLGLDAAIERSVASLLSTQHPDGHWVFELEADATIPAEYILLRHYLGTIDEEDYEAVEQRIARYLREVQGEDGGWPLFYGGAVDISASVKAYFALKAAGDPVDAPHMARARALILALGGARQSNVFTRIMLALWGEVPWRAVPVMPVEIMLLPGWFPVPCRQGVVLVAHRAGAAARADGAAPDRPQPARHHDRRVVHRASATRCRTGFRRRLRPRSAMRSRCSTGWFGWPSRCSRPTRGGARSIGPWLSSPSGSTARTGSAAFFRQWPTRLMMYDCLGYPPDHPNCTAAATAMRKLLVTDGERGYCQPCVSPVWDTALAAHALMEVGEATLTPAIRRSLDWLEERQVLDTVGDWAVARPGLRPGGWAFQYANPHYPDLDDTAAVALALSRFDRARYRDAIDRAAEWVIGMQSRNGGWGSFDADNTHSYLNHIPFADHGALLDPPTADVSARCVGFLAQIGTTPDHPAMSSALDYLLREQEADGSWFGRWGTNYIYGTWSVLTALNAAGTDPNAPTVRRAVAWLVAHQRADGGWGETGESYSPGAPRGEAPYSTASQTAWALLALMAAGEVDNPAVARGIAYLIATQDQDGNWDEPWYTAVGFPRVFYLRYHGYRAFFPLWALARYRRLSVANSRRVPFGL